MLMTHVDLIEKLLKYAYSQNCNIPSIILGPDFWRICTVADSFNRYNPAERDAKKAAMG